MSALFSAVTLAPRDPILGLNEQFNADTRPQGQPRRRRLLGDEPSAAAPVGPGRLGCVPCPQSRDGIAITALLRRAWFLRRRQAVPQSYRAIIGGTARSRSAPSTSSSTSAQCRVLISRPGWEPTRPVHAGRSRLIETYYPDASLPEWHQQLARWLDLNGARRHRRRLHACCHNPRPATT